MAEHEAYGSCGVFGCLSTVAGIAGLVATLTLGPIDFTRTVYNQIIGDTPILKRELVNYCRNLVDKNFSRDTLNREIVVERELARGLKVPYSEQGRIDPMEVSIESLWDYIEDKTDSYWDRWIWP